MKVLEKTYQKTEKAPTFPAGETLNVTTLRDKAKFFEIILSVKNPEFTHFLEVLGKGAENKNLIDRGYVQLLQNVQMKSLKIGCLQVLFLKQKKKTKHFSKNCFLKTFLKKKQLKNLLMTRLLDKSAKMQFSQKNMLKKLNKTRKSKITIR